jgi:hypothetical protein
MFRCFNRCFSWLFVLVLRVSSTRTRRYDIEYEYHFIEYEYEYEKSQNSATSKALGAGALGAGALGACSRATQYHTQIAHVRVGRTGQKDMTRRTQDRVRIAPLQGI